ncbi:MAG: hypothetical protein ABI895_30330 [Deltaproteobacteria bacterium]
MTRGRATRGDGIVRWLLPASVLHVAIVLLAAALSPWSGPAPQRAAAQPSSVEPEWIIELTLLDDGAGSTAVRAAPSRATPFEAAPPPANAEPRVARVTVDVPPPDAARVGAEPSHLPAAARLESATSATPSLPGRDEPPASTAANKPLLPAARTLSLDQLGIGTNPFLGVAIEPLTKEELANARLQAALHPPSLDRDRRRGSSPAGPVAAAARRLILADDGLLETSAVLNVRVDSAGHVTEVQVLEASSQVRVWQLLSARLATALEPVTLRAAGSKQGWGMKLRLASSVRLPSGAAPGMRIGVLGQQVAGSGGPGSTSLELSPTSKLDLKEPIDSIGRHLDDPIRFEVMLLKFRADPTDIGAPARRVVEVAVLSLDEPATP